MDIENLISLLNQISNKKSGNDFIDNLNDKSDELVKILGDSVPLQKTNKNINDSYGNSLLSIGNDSKTELFSNYTFTNDTLNWPLWLALYNDSWVFARAIDKPAQDCVKAGLTILNDISNKNEIDNEIKNYRDDMIQLFTWGRLFGGSIAIAMFDNFKEREYRLLFLYLKARKKFCILTIFALSL